ncbi:MAG: hypothetical protein H7Y36_01945 [Armatimonadetes bacterium]|nr:hypothetical protein [Akkermansiaceae bacterium]
MLYEVIINRESGSGIFRDMEQQNRLKRIFTDNGHRIELHVAAPEELDGLLQKKAQSPAEVLIIGGGDGTVTGAAKLLQGTGKALGVLPLGTFNLEARDLNISLDPFKAAEELMNSEIVEIDLMTVDDECCLCATVIGFYPNLAKSRKSFHGKSWWTKFIRIVHDICTVAVSSPALKLEITIDGETIHRRTRLAAFSPGQYDEGIGIIPNRSELSSGKLTAYVSEHLNRGQMLKAAVAYITGSLLKTEEMTRLESSEITIGVGRRKTIPAMIDGEIVNMKMPCHLKILPRALKVLRPRKPAN